MHSAFQYGTHGGADVTFNYISLASQGNRFNGYIPQIPMVRTPSMIEGTTLSGAVSADGRSLSMQIDGNDHGLMPTSAAPSAPHASDRPPWSGRCAP